MKTSQKMKHKAYKPKTTNKTKSSPNAKEINIEDGLTYFLQRLDKLSQYSPSKKHSTFGTLFEK